MKLEGSATKIDSFACKPLQYFLLQNKKKKSKHFLSVLIP